MLLFSAVSLMLWSAEWQFQYPVAVNVTVTQEQLLWVFRFLGSFAKNCEKQLLTSSRLDICLSVRMEQFGSHWTDFREI